MANICKLKSGLDKPVYAPKGITKKITTLCSIKPHDVTLISQCDFIIFILIIKILKIKG